MFREEGFHRVGPKRFLEMFRPYIRHATRWPYYTKG